MTHEVRWGNFEEVSAWGIWGDPHCSLPHRTHGGPELGAVSGEGGVDAGRVTGRIRGGPLAPDLRPATELTAQPPLPASACPSATGAP